ncbi:MAG: rhodanese-like domain-containing protein [Sphingobium sp.]|nr:rhodanese-like domain-containing protein [Sphingobium sp.]
MQPRRAALKAGHGQSGFHALARQSYRRARPAHCRCDLAPPDSGRDAAEEFRAAHLPGAIFLDAKGIAEPHHPVLGMLPSAERFAQWVGDLGISASDRIVFYDDSPHHTSARAWFMFRLFGARRVAILDGGLAKWRAEGHPLESGAPQSRPATTFSAPSRPFARAGQGANAGVARRHRGHHRRRAGTGPFQGAEAEPRPGMPAGHLPGSRNLPYATLFNADGTFKDANGLSAAFAAAGVPLDKPIVTTCGSGVTAADVLFAAHLLGKEDVALTMAAGPNGAPTPPRPRKRGQQYERQGR